MRGLDVCEQWVIGSPWYTTEVKADDDTWRARIYAARAELDCRAGTTRRRDQVHGLDDYKAKAEQFDALVATANDAGDGSTGEGDAKPDTPDAPDLPDAPDVPNLAARTAPPEDGLQAENTQLRTRLLRQQICAQRGLDPDLWDRVKGDTADEIATDAGKLAAKFGTIGGSRPPKPLSSGAGATTYQSPKERAASALRCMSRSE